MRGVSRTVVTVGDGGLLQFENEDEGTARRRRRISARGAVPRGSNVLALEDDVDGFIDNNPNCIVIKFDMTLGDAISTGVAIDVRDAVAHAIDEAATGVINAYMARAELAQNTQDTAEAAVGAAQDEAVASAQTQDEPGAGAVE